MFSHWNLYLSESSIETIESFVTDTLNSVKRNKLLVLIGLKGGEGKTTLINDIIEKVGKEKLVILDNPRNDLNESVNILDYIHRRYTFPSDYSNKNVILVANKTIADMAKNELRLQFECIYFTHIFGGCQGNCGNQICYVTKTNELCESFAKQNGFSLSEMTNQTPYICELAVKQNAMALKYIKEQTHYLCMLAVKLNGLALQYVKEKTEDLCKEAVSNNGLALQYVDPLLQTLDVITTAIAQNKNAKLYVNIEGLIFVTKTVIKQYEDLHKRYTSTKMTYDNGNCEIVFKYFDECIKCASKITQFNFQSKIATFDMLKEMLNQPEFVNGAVLKSNYDFTYKINFNKVDCTCELTLEIPRQKPLMPFIETFKFYFHGSSNKQGETSCIEEVD